METDHDQHVMCEKPISVDVLATQDVISKVLSKPHSSSWFHSLDDVSLSLEFLNGFLVCSSLAKFLQMINPTNMPSNWSRMARLVGLISLCCAMEGYDIALIGNFYAFPPFSRKYGELQPNGSYQVPAKWQAGISNGAQCGQIIGLLRSYSSPSPFTLIADHSLVTSYGVEKVGYRPFLLGVLFYQCAVTTIFFVAPSVKILLLAECLAGVAFGVFMSGMSMFLDGAHK